MNKCEIKVRMELKDIVFLDNIIEGYDSLAVVSNGKLKTGEVTLHVTPDTYDDVLDILRNFPWPITIIS